MNYNITEEEYDKIMEVPIDWCIQCNENGCIDNAFDCRTFGLAPVLGGELQIIYKVEIETAQYILNSVAQAAIYFFKDNKNKKFFEFKDTITGLLDKDMKLGVISRKNENCDIMYRVLLPDDNNNCYLPYSDHSYDFQYDPTPYKKGEEDNGKN